MRYSASISTAPQTMAVWPSTKVPPSRVMPSGMSVMVCASEYNCVIANAMFIVPSVTMNGGSAILVTNRPLTRPNSTVTAMPLAMASGADRSWLAAILVITMLPSDITMPQDRSMPAVRITSVWTIAITPTTITCCRISEKVCADKKRSLCEAKKAQARISAMKGPSVASVTCGGRRKVIDGMWGWLRARVKRVHGAPADAAQRAWPSRRWSPPCRAGVAGATDRRLATPAVADLPLLLLAPAQAGAGFHVLAVHAGFRVGGNHPPVDIGDAGAAAVHRHDEYVLFLACGFQCLMGAGRCRFVDAVQKVDVGVLLQAVFHRGLALGAVAKAVGHADHLGRAGQFIAAGLEGRQTETLEEAVVPLRAHRVAREQIEHRNHRLLARHCRLGVLADQLAGLVVVSGKQGIDDIHRIGGAVQRNHHHAAGPGLLDRRHDGLGVVRGDQDGLGPGIHQGLPRRHRAGIVAIGLSGGGGPFD